MNIILFFVILVVLILSHEFGHFIVAKKSGIRVDEFGFGFPPKLFSIKKGETEYSFNAIPFGGFVKIFGETPDEESLSGPDSKRSFINKPKLIQAAVLIAGVVFNLLLAWLLLSVGFMAGMPTSVEGAPRGTVVQNVSLTVVNVLPSSPAEAAGLQVGDRVISLREGDSFIADLSPESVQEFISTRPGQEITVEYERAREISSLTVIPKEGLIEEGPAIGIAMDMVGILKLRVPRALLEGAAVTASLTAATAVALVTLLRDAFIGQADVSALTGPIGIVGIVGDAYQFGIVYLLSFTAFISINLAIINLIPFPALDGGRLLFLLIERIKGSPIRPYIANALNTIGFFLLILLMLVVTYHDIVKLF